MAQDQGLTSKSPHNKQKQVIIFDGVCNLCNAAVRFILERDDEAHFLFSPAQSTYAQDLIQRNNLPEVGDNTLLLVKEGSFLFRSDAVFEILGQLPGYWFLLKGFKILPGVVRDYFYNLIGKNRYKLFGRTDECVLPHRDYLTRFIID